MFIAIETVLFVYLFVITRDKLVPLALLALLDPQVLL